MYVFTCTCTQQCRYTCTVCKYMYTHVHNYVCTHVLYVFTCTHMYTTMYVHMYCIYLYFSCSNVLTCLTMTEPTYRRCSLLLLISSNMMRTTTSSARQVDCYIHVHVRIFHNNVRIYTNKAKRNLFVCLSGMAGHALYGMAHCIGHTGVTFDAENDRPGPGSLRGHFEAARDCF